MGSIAATATAIADTIRLRMPDDVTVQGHDPGGTGFDAPLVAVGLPDLELPGYDEGHTQLGLDDWDALWPVTLYVDYHDPEDDANRAKDLLERVVDALRADPTCDGTVEDASVTAVRTGYNDADTNRRLIVVEFDVATYLPQPRT